MEACKPIANGYITSGYGWRTNPFNPAKKQLHPGIDVSCKSIKPLVCTPLAGVVVVTGFSETFGNRVWIKLDNGLFMVLAHLDSIELNIRVGLRLKPGDFVGIMGNTGLSKAPHCHIEIRVSPYKPGNSQEPTEIIKTFKV